MKYTKYLAALFFFIVSTGCTVESTVKVSEPISEYGTCVKVRFKENYIWNIPERVESLTKDAEEVARESTEKEIEKINAAGGDISLIEAISVGTTIGFKVAISNVIDKGAFRCEFATIFDAGGTVAYEPVFIPAIIKINKNGVSIEVSSPDIITPIGVFSVEKELELLDLHNEKRLLLIYIDDELTVYEINEGNAFLWRPDLDETQYKLTVFEIAEGRIILKVESLE